MIPYKKIVLIWIPTFVLIIIGAFVDGFENWGAAAGIICRGSSALLGIISLMVAKSEINAGSRVVFLTFAVFFGWIALLTPVFQLVGPWVLQIDEWIRFYFYEYNLLAYFFLLGLCVIYIVCNHVLGRLAVWKKFAMTLSIVGGLTAYLFLPMFTDPLYLTEIPEFKNLKSVHKAIEHLRENGRSTPSVEEIVALAQFESPETTDANVQLTHEQKTRYAHDVIPYDHGDDVYMLLYRDLWTSCYKMGLFDLLALVVLVVYKYFIDNPEAAYMEKIAWCLLPFICFEVLHHYVFVKIHSYDTYMKITTVGGYLSTALIWMLFPVFGARYRFIHSAEGEYYERRLIMGAVHVTRWRDALDNWVVRQFLKEESLKRRFLVRRKTNL
jgi:hypothetical protein